MVLQDHPACQPDKGEVSIDTFSFTIDLDVIRSMRYSGVDLIVVDDVLKDPTADDNWFLWLAFSNLLSDLFGPGIAPAENFTSGRNFFKWSLPLADRGGFVAFGGNNKVVDFSGKEKVRPERIQFYISGEGCQRVKDWSNVYQMLRALSDYTPKITRIDIAYDDHEGQRDVDYAADSYRAGLFAGNGRPPKGQRIDDMGSGDGCTFYVGSRDSGRYLRIYEKGKQLGDKGSDWVRWEVELSAKQMDIPLDVLIFPRRYLAGSYPCLDWISRAKLVIETAKKREHIEFHHLVAHGRRAYGALINYMLTKRSMSNDDVVGLLIRDSIPGRLSWTAGADLSEKQAAPHEVLYPHLYITNEVEKCSV